MRKKDVLGIRENLGFLLAKASQRWNELLYEGFCRANYPDVRPAYGSILIPLFEEDGLQMGELARRAWLSKQTMTTLIKAMEQKGLVVRRRDPEDARAFRIYLTDRSRRFRAVAEEVLKELDERVKAQLTPERVSILKNSLKALLNLSP